MLGKRHEVSGATETSSNPVADFCRQQAVGKPPRHLSWKEISVTQYSTLPHSKTRLTHPRVFRGVATPSVLAKTVIVALLGYLLAWRPSLAMLLGGVVLRAWPHLRRV
jgi:hypothetical protein